MTPKNINDLTIKEFNEYSELIQDKKPDVFSIMELFGIENPAELKTDVFNKYWKDIQSQQLSTRGTKKIYKIGNRRFEPTLNLLKLSAGQFIDFQSYMCDYKLHQVLSVFLIPQYKNKFFWKTYKYADGYDAIEVQEYLLNNMKIGEASELATFFLKLSTVLLESMKQSSQRKLIKMKKNHIKESKHHKV